MNPPDEALLQQYDAQTRKGYPLGEVRQDLLERGYSEADADAFMQALGARIGQKVAHKEQRLIPTAALLLFACGLVLFVFGGWQGILFMIAGAGWWIYESVSKKQRPG
ncbi:hypothetical protein [Flaviaesturariibacter amylovorans]|uniref:DUF1707 domain-containing protein n=1 Tax=Flaviaesturariibacter amylovorans TaxID=1084520 RepID=A0ABP8G811_9BACT